MSRSNSTKRKRNRPQTDRMHPVGYCKTTHKRMWGSRAEAKRALKSARKFRAGRRADHYKAPERSVYECRHCGAWHLTSQEPRPSSSDGWHDSDH